MDCYSDDEHDHSSHHESDLALLKRENFMLRQKLLDQKREIDELRAEGHSSSGEDKDPKMDNMEFGTGAIGRRVTRDSRRFPLRMAGDLPLPEPITTEPQPPVEKLDPALVGMSPGLKHLYSGKEDRRGRYQWQTTIPKDVGRPAEDAETAKWALIIYNDPQKVLAMHSIVVQSPYLKDFLKRVLAGYPGVTVGLDRLEFSGRFEPLIHRWKELNAALDELKTDVDVKGPVNEAISVVENPTTINVDPVGSDEGKERINGQTTGEAPETEKPAEVVESEPVQRYKHAKLLHDLLSTEFQADIESSADMKAKGVMTYDHLWTLFEPGQLVYNRQEGQDRLFKLISGGRYGQDHNGNNVFWLLVQYIDYDGTKYGTQRLNIKVRQFAGTQSITSLSCFPLDYHKERKELEDRLVERATKIEALAGTHYRAYEGIGWRSNPHGGKDKFPVKGRVVIDTFGWNRFNPNLAIYVTSLQHKDTAAARLHGYDSEALCEHDYRNDDDMEDGIPMDGLSILTKILHRRMIDKVRTGHFEDEEEERRLVPLSNEQKLICSHLLRGYALKEKLWLNLYINSVKDIAFNDRAFDSLVIPDGQKELILGFTASQQAYRNAFDDVIEGKGRGIVVLLSGPPGVGKTLTAESVAEEMRVPLYVMSAGDLGLDSRQIEAKLQNCFEMVTRWNAILLLDEADVFLEERSLHELERNKLVSIFLRVLEYYEGIMFLTTNRVNIFDAAFQSRIHISLDYSELTIESRKAVWTNFLKQHNIVQSSIRAKGPPKASASTAKAPPTTADKPAVDGASNEDDGAIALAAHEKATQPHAITDAQISQLALMQMNGRQIKNILKTATLLANRRNEALKKDHITTVLQVTQHLHNANRETDRARGALYN
ncbi:hypothetical protein MBLNU457_3099t1 [Dothideomycetes sp. NU457]